MILEKYAGFTVGFITGCHRSSLKSDSRFGIHWANATILLLTIVTMNVIVLLFASAFVFPVVVPVSAPKSILFLIFAGIVLGHKGRYKKIIGEFQRENAEQQGRGDLLFGWYLVLSLFLLIAIFIVAAIRA